MDVSSWLRNLGLDNYAQAFRANHIDAQVLSRLTAEHLIALGVVSIGHRHRLLDAFAALRGEDMPAAVSTADGRPEPTADTTIPALPKGSGDR